MINLTITDVRPTASDSGYLIDDGTTSILFDTGLAFTGHAMAENIKKALGDRNLDYIFLSHSHYDHALGTPYVSKMYPDAKVVAGSYARKIFEKPTARAKMRELDRKAAEKYGVTEYEDLIDELTVDITVNEGDTITCGAMTFTVIELPGHTRCSVGFYLPENKMLLSTETLGGYFGDNIYIPSFLIGYQLTLDSFEKVKSLPIDSFLVPHYGPLNKEEAANHLKNAEQNTIETAMEVKELLQNGYSTEEVVEHLKKSVYTSKVSSSWPVDAFELNMGIMVELVKKELL